MKEKQTGIPEVFLKPYNPAEHEDKLYQMWEESGFFNPDVCVEKGVTAADAEPFSIVLPPPNVTGTLHMGHASMLAIEDILVRYNRMQGKRTLWLPGTDSAAVATQEKVEKELYKKEKLTRYDLGREALIERIIAFSEESKSTIIGQTKKMGSSLDWSRYAYTLDDERYHAVMTAFVRMYEAGLIYRGARIVNWDPKMQTTISDDEIDYVEQTDPFYYFKYGPFTIGTVRPETKFGDKYVVMHPDDDRYKEYEHGQTIEVEWINGPITATIIKDEAADPEMGTGVMTITPWHSAVDFEIAQRHGLSQEQIIDERGILLPIAGEFAGQHIKKARAAIVEKMQAKGLVEKVDEKYVHNVATNSRGGGMIEPQIKEQWFVDVNKEFTMGPSEVPGVHEGDSVSLKQLMQKAVSGGGTTIFPDRFNKTYYHWIDNLRDWCISRQIWYGHRIPVWYKDGEMKVQIESPGDGWEQDPDTLDTWFSSGLWTFSTLGWPNETTDLKTYHPTTVLETGYDIIFFWVARMILMSTFLVGQVPFKNVYLHGLVRDEKGKKMSKSLGNIIDPLDMIEKFGADATRLSLIVGAAPGNDMPLSEDKVRAYKKFANKLWNISRFTLDNILDADFTAEATFSERDQEILQTLSDTVTEVSSDIEKFNLYLAAEKAYHYVWHDLADKVLEESKPILNGEDAAARYARQYVLKECLVTSLKLLHPFMPYVTEAIWQELPTELKDQEMIMVAAWPKQD
ncbi:valine--tRNA ligase [Candidatus Kaiserbacteria bacterium]|nr:valine--tRNA ligase [Candidatus Kaiserbacteria bacterium]MCB9811302.1 valine--tRNA ligase [Candidatus Nomurabacteria bacterium]